MRRLSSVLLALMLAVPAVAAVTVAQPAGADAPTYTPVQGRTILLTPSRILDTRTGNGAPPAALTPHQTLALQIAGRGGVPQGGVAAVYLTLTETAATSAGFLTAWPDTFGRPVASSLNFSGPAPIANTVVEAVPADGRINIYNGSVGRVHVIVDVTGYVIGRPLQENATSSGLAQTIAGGLIPRDTRRDVDTRVKGEVPLAPGTALPIPYGSPETNVVAAAVSVNLTVVDPPSAGYLTLAPPTSTSRPSLLNFAKGQTVANSLIVPITAGYVSVYNVASAPVDVVIDVGAIVDLTGATSPSGLIGIAPTRVLDTRVAGKPVAAHATQTIDVGTEVPADASGVLVNLTQTGAASGGYLTGWAHGGTKPTASVANFAPHTTSASFAVLPIGADHSINVYNGSAGTVSLIADVFGYVSAAGTTAPAVTNLVASATDTTADVSWTRPAGADRTIVRRRTGPNPPTSVFDGEPIADGTATAVTDTGLRAGTMYTYTAFAISPDGGLAATAPAFAVTTRGSTDPVSSFVGYLSSTEDPSYELGHSVGFDTSNGNVYPQVLTTSEISLATFTAFEGDSVELDLLAPQGQNLHAGYYPQLTSWGSRVDGLPAASYSFGSTGFDANGPIEIRDLASDSSGAVTRLDLLFTERVNDDGKFLTGEFRYGYADQYLNGYTVSARALNFGTTPIGVASIALPVWIDNTGTEPVTVGASAVSSKDFAIQSDNCVGRTLQPRWTCSVTVVQTPQAAGPRTGTLAIRVGTHVETVQLDAAVPAGHTELDLSAGGYIGGAYPSTLPDSAWPMTAAGNGTRAVFQSTGPPESNFDVGISAPVGQKLTTGNHVAGGFGSASTWGIDVSGPGRACSSTHGSVDVKQITLAADGSPLHADFTFIQYCDNVEDPVTGHVQWRNEADQTPPAPVTRFAATGTGATRTVAWHDPADVDYAYTVVKLSPGTTVAPVDNGFAIYSGKAQSATVTGLLPGVVYTLVAYPVDASGNVGVATTTTVTG